MAQALGALGRIEEVLHLPTEDQDDAAVRPAAAIATLWWIMLAGATAIALGMGALLAAAWAGWPRLAAAHPDRLTLWGGLVFPLVVLIALVAAALATSPTLRGARARLDAARARVGPVCGIAKGGGSMTAIPSRGVRAIIPRNDNGVGKAPYRPPRDPVGRWATCGAGPAATMTE